MKTFFNVEDLGDLKAALAEAQEVKANRFGYQELGKNKTLLMIFFNNSLRTRLSTQKAAMNLGMNVIVLDVNAGAWKLETERGVIMDGDKSEHLLEAIPVMGSFCDLIGVRSFAGLKDREYDYAETIVNQFVKYSGRPVFAMETATVHPLQAFADLITIEEHKKVARPKVVLTWAPHCRALPQAVPNSFAQWMNAADVDSVVTHPEGYELDPKSWAMQGRVRPEEGAGRCRLRLCQELELSGRERPSTVWRNPEQGYELDHRRGAHELDQRWLLHALSASSPWLDCNR